jgi:hypothetical protein
LKTVTIIKHLTISRARLLPSQAAEPQCQQSSPCAELTSEFPLRQPSLLLLLGWPQVLLVRFNPGLNRITIRTQDARRPAHLFCSAHRGYILHIAAQYVAAGLPSRRARCPSPAYSTPKPASYDDHVPLLPRTRLTTHFRVRPLPSSLTHACQRLLRLFTQVDCRCLLRPAQAIARAIALPVALSHATKVPMSRCLSADLARLQYGLTAFAATSLPTSPSPTTRRVGLPAMT